MKTKLEHKNNEWSLNDETKRNLEAWRISQFYTTQKVIDKSIHITRFFPQKNLWKPKLMEIN